MARAIVYERTGGPEVLQPADRPVREPGPGEVRVRVHVSGVNPTDWKSRTGSGDGAPPLLGPTVPNQDGAGVVEAVGQGVDPAVTGRPVWIWEAAYQRTDGTAQQYVTLPQRNTVLLPEPGDFDLGASLGVPFLTAHRTLTVTEGGPARLGPGALAGRVVLVAGGAGAVGNAAIQLARWSDATVITTVSSPAKARLAAAAGADHVIDYRTQDVVHEVRAIAPHGVHTIVEVAASNASIDADVLAADGSIAIYADSGGAQLQFPVRPLMVLNARLQWVLLYTVPLAAKVTAIDDVSAAVADGAVRVGEAAGLPLLRFPLERTADAHAAVEGNAVGKVLIDVG